MPVPGTGAKARAERPARASGWTLDDLRKAEGRPLHADAGSGGTIVTAQMSEREQRILAQLADAPPGTGIKDGDLAPEHLRRVHMESEFVYGLDGTFHRNLWRYDDGRGTVLGYRAHSQPKNLLSGKYIVAFYGPDAKLLMAQPVWY